MSSDLDLRSLHRAHEPDPAFVARLRGRLQAAANDTPGEAAVAEVITEVIAEPVAGAAGAPHNRLVLRAAAAVVLVAGIATVFVLTDTDDPVLTETEPGPTAPPVAGAPLARFSGMWITVDADERTLTMTIADAGDGTAEVTVLDRVASMCAGAPSTMTGTGEVASSGDLVITAPDLTCDDGTEPEALGEPPVEEQLRDLTFTLVGSDALTDSSGRTWRRVESTTSTIVPAETPTSGGMWPQSTLEEVRAAQQLADAGDPGHTWQVGARLSDEDPFTQVELELVDRFLREVLGWEAYLYNVLDGGDFSDWPGATSTGWVEGSATGQRYFRCAPGRTNPLYPGHSCAPTLDDLRYESVSLDLVQPDRQGRDGIWVVNRWELTTPFTQADPAHVEALTRERLEEFLAARIAGEGAEGHVQVVDDREVPLLYATSSGAPYERYEIELQDGPLWPYADMTFSARLLADGGTTVVEQQIRGRAIGDGLWLDPSSTTENGQPVVISHTSSDGEVTVSAPSTWGTWSGGGTSHDGAPGVWFWELLRGGDDVRGDRIEFTDPVAYDSWCAANGGSPLLSAPADASAIAQQVVADPNFETTAPVAASVGGVEAVSIDVALAPGGRPCGVGMIVISRWIHALWEPGWRLRLYLVDLPEGMSVRTMAITVVAPEERFDEVIAETAPIIDSIEFRPG